MAGYEVMPALEAAERGDVFVTVTGSRRVLRGEHFERMKDGAILANAGHFDVELDLEELRALAAGGVPGGRAPGPAVHARRRPAAEPARSRASGQPGRRRGPSRRGHGRLLRPAGAERRGAGAAPALSSARACTPSAARSTARSAGSSSRRSGCGSTRRPPSRRATASPGAEPLARSGVAPAHWGRLRQLTHGSATDSCAAASISGGPRSRRSSSTPISRCVGQARQPTPTEGGPADVAAPDGAGADRRRQGGRGRDARQLAGVGRRLARRRRRDRRHGGQRAQPARLERAVPARADPGRAARHPGHDRQRRPGRHRRRVRLRGRQALSVGARACSGGPGWAAG